MSTVTQRKKRVTFSMSAAPEADVYLLGTFNDWQPSDLKMKYDPEVEAHVLSFYLPRGRHEYKYIVDGMWCVDPSCSGWTLDERGYMNSVIEVG